MTCLVVLPQSDSGRLGIDGLDAVNLALVLALEDDDAVADGEVELGGRAGPGAAGDGDVRADGVGAAAVVRQARGLGDGAVRVEAQVALGGQGAQEPVLAAGAARVGQVLPDLVVAALEHAHQLPPLRAAVPPQRLVRPLARLPLGLHRALHQLLHAGWPKGVGSIGSGPGDGESGAVKESCDGDSAARVEMSTRSCCRNWLWP